MATGQTIIARPYARAAFEYALTANQIAVWGDFLHYAARVVQNPTMHRWILDPRVSQEQLLETLCAIGKEWVQEPQKNFLKLLIENHRLRYLPKIYSLFIAYQDEHEQKVEVTVKTFMPFSEQQTKHLISVLEQRLQKKVQIEFKIDPALLGGAVITAGDLVIDGSLRSKLKRLKHSLAFE